jgi:hypothetical protein
MCAKKRFAKLKGDILQQSEVGGQEGGMRSEECGVVLEDELGTIVDANLHLSQLVISDD